MKTLIERIEILKIKHATIHREVEMLEFVNDNENIDIPILEIDKKVQREQIKRIKLLRENRKDIDVKYYLNQITNASQNSTNLIPLIVAAAKSYATLGEIIDSMKVVFGEWQENIVI